MTCHVIMAVHDRRQLTVNAIRHAIESAKWAKSDLTFTVFDDGSTDGTREALQCIDARIKVIRGDGDSFWAGGMAVAERFAASSANEDDWLVWMNDDVELYQESFTKACAAMACNRDSVLVASLVDPSTTALTYGGFRCISWWQPLRLSLVEPRQGVLTPIDTFNGNLVFVPVSVVRKIGGIDGRFDHSMADIEFGFRCKRNGVRVLLLSGIYGTCRRNAPVQGDLLTRWRKFVGIKGGGNMHNLIHLLRRMRPVYWPALIVGIYFKWWARAISASLRRTDKSLTRD